MIAGGAALGGLAVLHGEAHSLYHRLTTGDALPALIVSIVAGLGTLALVLARRFEPARLGASVAVAAIIAGWALGQEPVLLPHLTIAQAAAPHDTLVLVVVVVLGGAAILFPSLALLFKLVLGGRFDPGADSEPAPPLTAHAVVAAARSGLVARLAGGCLIAGIGLLTIADARWAHAVGVVSLLAFVVLGFAAVGPTELATAEDESRR